MKNDNNIYYATQHLEKAKQELKETQKKLFEERRFKGFIDDDKTASGVDI